MCMRHQLSSPHIPCRWVVGVSYKVGFGHDPMLSMGGGMLSSFEPVPGTIHLDSSSSMEVTLGCPSMLATWARVRCGHAIRHSR